MFDIHDLNTGDLILFHGNGVFPSGIIECVTNSYWSHIGMVLKDPTYIDPKLKGYYLLESGLEPVKESEDDMKVFGVQIVELQAKINRYDGAICYRKLASHNITDDGLARIHRVVHHKPYDLDLFDIFSASMKIKTRPGERKGCLKYITDKKKINRFYCSALIGYILTELGIIDKNTEWTECEPSTFSEKNTNLRLIDAAIGKQVMIK